MFMTNPLLNNIDWSISGVDPLGRFFIYNMTIYKLKTNFLQGPDFDFILRFNSLTDENAGFGLGWELCFTSVRALDDDTGNKVLFLPDGRKFVISVTVDRQVVFVNNDDPKEFNLKSEDDGYFRVSYKNGITEIIDGNGRLSKIETLFGNYVTFEWNGEKLHKIKDMATDVISISYTDDNSATSSDHNVCVTYGSKRTNFKFDHNSLSITLNDIIENKSTNTFKFTYASDAQLSKITSVTVSGNKNERIKINYSSVPLAYKTHSGNLTVGQVESIQRTVNSSDVDENSSADKLIVSYNDDLGRIFSPVQVQFINDKKESEGFQVSEEIEGVRKVTRQYNNYGQLINEITLESEKVLDINTDCRYISFTYASEAYSAPLVRINEYEILNGQTYTRVSKSYTYDTEYNLTEYIDDEGKKIAYEYYASDDRLSEPNGMEVVYLNSDCAVKYLKSETISYIAKCHSEVPDSGKNLSKKKTYFYTYLPSPRENDNRKYIILSITEEKYLNTDVAKPVDIQKSVTIYDYFPSNDFLFGRIRVIRERRENNATEILTTSSYKVVQDNKVLETSEKKEIVGYGVNSAKENSIVIYTNRTGHYIDNGLVSWEIVPGEIVVYKYDYLNRLISKNIAGIDHKDSIEKIIASTTSAAEIVEIYEYSDFAVKIKTTNKLATIKTYDYNAKLIDTKYSTRDLENIDKFYHAQNNTYDKLGRVLKESIWIVDSTMAQKKNSVPDIEISYEYNVYGDVCKKSTFRKVDTSEVDKLIVSDEEVFTFSIPFSVQQIDKNKLIRTIISQVSDGTGVKSVHTLVASVGTSKKVYKDETIFFDSMNRVAVTKNALAGTSLIISYDQYDHVISEQLYKGKPATSPIDEISYQYNIDKSPYANEPSQIKRNGIVISSMVFDSTGRGIFKNFRGQNLITEYNDDNFPLKPTKTILCEGEMIQDKNTLNKYLQKKMGMCTLFEYDKKGNKIRKKIFKNGKNENSGSVFIYYYNDYGKIKKSELKQRDSLVNKGTIAYNYDVFDNIIEEYSGDFKTNYNRMSDGSISSTSTELNNKTYVENHIFKGGLIAAISFGPYIDYKNKTFIDVKLTRNIYNANKLSSVDYKINLSNDKGEYHIRKNNFQYDEVGRLTGYRIFSGAFEYNISWEFNSDGHIEKITSQGFNNEQDGYSEKYKYDDSGNIISWSGSGGTHLGRDEYDNKINKVSFEYDKAGDLNKLQYSTIDNILINKKITYDKYKRISLVTYTPNSPPPMTTLPNIITYGYNSEYNEDASFDGSVSFIKFKKEEVFIQYVSNGFSYAEIYRVGSVGNGIDMTPFREKKSFSYDAQERIIATVDGGGYVILRPSAPSLVQKTTKEFSRYLLDKLKFSTFQYSPNNDKTYKELVKKYYIYLDDNVDIILNIDANDRFVGVECFARLPGGEMAASIVISYQNGKVKTNGREYSRGPICGAFIVHDAILS